MDTNLTKLIENMPALDAQMAKSTEDLRERLNVVQYKVDDLRELLTAGDVNLSYEEFKESLDQLKIAWGSSEGFARRMAEIRGDVTGMSLPYVEFSDDPVNLSTGNFVYDHEDMKIGGEIPLSFHRYYNALDRTKGSLGRCFLHNYEISLKEDAENGKATVHMGDGQKKTFRKEKDGTYRGLHSALETLTKEEDTYVLQELSGMRYTFDGSGHLIRQEDRLHKGITFLYDTAGRLEKAVTDHETFLAYRYDEAGLLIQVTDHTGRTVKLTYEKGKLATVETPRGSRYVYRYGKNGRIEEAENARGYVAVRNTFDDKRRVTRQDFPDGGHMEFAYDDSKRQVILTERNGSKTTYVHDSKYRNTDILYEDGTREHFAYNGKNQRVLHVDRNGNTTRMSYDNRGNLTQVINALGEKRNYTYNADNRLISFAVNGKEKLKNTYDNRGNLLSSVGADGYGNQLTYDEAGRPVCIEKADHSRIRIAYDARGNIERLTDTLGNTTSYSYDTLNRVTKVLDAKGYESGYEYDPAGDLIKFTNAAGEVRTYAYDESKNVTEIVDFNKSRIRRSYNALNKLESVTDPEGRVTRLGYDVMWNVEKITLPNGAVTTYSYDQNNRLVTVTDAMGSTMRFTYDGNGNRLSIEDRMGAKTTFAYDALNRLIQVTDPEGAEMTYEYDNEGKLVRATDALGNEAVRTYDTKGRLAEERDSSGKSRAYTYTEMGNVKSVTTESGLMIRYCYLPGETRISSIEYPDGTKESYTYDANGNLKTKTDRQGYTKTYHYDCLNRLSKVTTPEGEQKAYAYDAVGNVISMTDALGNVTHYEYSLTGRLTKVTDALGNVTEYTYDETDRLIGILQKGEKTEEPPRRTEYTRDLLGNIETVTDALGGREHYRYNQRGELIEKLDKEGYLTQYGYTLRGDLNHMQYADGREVMLSYNALRQLEEIRDWLGVTQIKNDAAGRATEVIYPNGERVAYTYGELGKRSSLTYPDGKTVHYGYDELSRLTELREGDAVIRYEYDALGRLSEKIFPNGMSTKYEYNARGLLFSLTHADTEGILDSYLYRYDQAANKTEIVKNRRGLPEESGSYRYGYDALGRLESVEKDGEILRTYQYDTYGNRVSLTESGSVQTYNYNALNQLISKVDVTAEGRTEEEYFYDKRGNLNRILLNGQMKNEYAYGPMNRLEWAVNGQGEEVTYLYDGLGHRVGKQEPGPIGKVDYVIDLTRQYQNLLQKEEAGRRQTFVWDGNAAEVIEGEDSRDFYLQDEMGSPIRLADMEGSLRESYGYDEFGQDLYGNQGQTQPFGYTGYQPERIAGTYYAQAREYVPSVGKFASRDLDRYMRIQDPNSINLYNYCVSNPMRYVDPSGNSLEDIIGDEESPYAGVIKHSEDDAVQISVEDNTMTIDVYVQFIGDEGCTTQNGTPCKDLAMAGMKLWSGYYKDILGEDIMIVVNVNTKDESMRASQQYVTIYFEQEDFTVSKKCNYTIYNGDSEKYWEKSDTIKVYLYNRNEIDNHMYTDEEYKRAVAHEMLHVFGVGDGYYAVQTDDGITDAWKEGIIEHDDIANWPLNRVLISETDIMMILYAFNENEEQFFLGDNRHKQSEYIKTKLEKE